MEAVAEVFITACLSNAVNEYEAYVYEVAQPKAKGQ